MRSYPAAKIGEKMKKWFYSLVLLLILAGCAPVKPQTSTLTVMTHDSFAISTALVERFELENNTHLAFIKGGDTGAILNRAILTKNSPEADILYGVDNTFLSRAIQEDIFQPYESPMSGAIPKEFLLAGNSEAMPVDYGDVCLNYDKTYFETRALALPGSLSDLTLPEYGKGQGDAGLLVVENPAISSPGLAFLLATVAEFGPDHYLEYWRALKENGVVVVNDWTTAYYTNFSGSSGKGAQPLVVSYASSPAAEVIYAAESITAAPTASLVADGMCFRQVEFVGILKGTQNEVLARKFVDFMLSREFQEDMPLQMFVYPVLPEAALPEEFKLYNQSPANPARLDPQAIAENRDAWIQAWTELMLR